MALHSETLPKFTLKDKLNVKINLNPAKRDLGLPSGVGLGELSGTRRCFGSLAHQIPHKTSVECLSSQKLRLHHFSLAHTLLHVGLPRSPCVRHTLHQLSANASASLFRC